MIAQLSSGPGSLAQTDDPQDRRQLPAIIMKTAAYCIANLAQIVASLELAQLGLSNLDVGFDEHRRSLQRASFGR